MQIYKVTNIVNGRFYIGKEKRNNKNYLGSGIMINNAIKKYGRKNFKKEIIQVCETEEEWNNAERYWIKELNSFYPIGYNIGQGGEGGDNISNNPNYEQIIENLKEGQKFAFRPYLTDEQRKRRSENAKEKNAKGIFGRTGKPHTLETRKKMSESGTGKIRTEEHCKNISKALKGKTLEEKLGKERADIIKQKISKARTGVPRTEETKQKLSVVNKGQIPWNKGKTGLNLSEETKKKIGLANKGKVRTEEFKKNVSEFHKGRKDTLKTRKRKSESMKGKKKSVEHCNNISKALKGNIPWNKGKLLEELVGKERADEIKRRNSESQKGKTYSEEYKKKMSESLKGRIFTKEHREKISIARKGKKYKKAV